MKKTGFTLAEVLVVLGVIGVVAALTLPSLMSDTAAAQIGPKLAKAIAMFDQANAGVLHDSIADHMADTGLINSFGNDYTNKLTDHLKAAKGGNVGVIPNVGNLSGGTYLTNVTVKDGTVYQVYYTSTTSSGGAPHKDRIGYVVIDLNGAADPNAAGTDVFGFTWWGDGSIKPAGGTGSDSGLNWTKQCKGSGTAVTDYWACAGHIMENNLKVLYE